MFGSKSAGSTLWTPESRSSTGTTWVGQHHNISPEISQKMLSKCRPHSSSFVKLGRDSNQALGLGQFAIDFLGGKFGDRVEKAVYDRVKLFHTDSVMCGISALAMKTNAPTILRNEALGYPDKNGACVFGSSRRCAPEKAIVANCSAVREWDSNGTVFGYNEKLPGHQAGEFGHNDFYPVVVAAASQTPVDGHKALRAMLLSDEIRGRLAEVFSLKSHKIDHVVHGAVASAAVYGALLGASADQIESAIGMTVAHYIPWRAIRAGKQLSDSKGASAAISTEAAILSTKRAMAGFQGPRDIFRNPEAIFRYFEKTNEDSPFDIVLSHSGPDFAVMAMHFKLGLYEHQSAGALQGVIELLLKHPEIVRRPSSIRSIEITAYEPAFGIIGDPAKRDPKTRQSADHSMVFIVSRLVQRANRAHKKGIDPIDVDSAWKAWMLAPHDYSKDALEDEDTRAIMEKITFKHGGPEFDAKYPEGIPTAVEILMKNGTRSKSGMVLFPAGHARNTSADLKAILDHKFKLLGSVALPEPELTALIEKLQHMEGLSAEQVAELYDFEWSKLRKLKAID